VSNTSSASTKTLIRRMGYGGKKGRRAMQRVKSLPGWAAIVEYDVRGARRFGAVIKEVGT
jgi:hypothetical protein